jgi:translation initiation factor IF-1
VSKADKIEFEGVVIDVCKDKFRVEVAQQSGTLIVICTPSGKMRQNSIKIVPGDMVDVEVSPYDLSRGRIIYRAK